MFVIFVDSSGYKWFYARREDGYWFRWQKEYSKREEWDIVPWAGF